MSAYSDLRNEYQKRRIDNVNKSDAEKSKLIPKMLLFNKLIEELVKWKEQKNRQTELEVLKDLSFVPLMKCLYIVCLLTVEENSEESLFDLFDKFVAYPKGPVDEDCYYFMDKLPEYTIRDYEGLEYLSKRQPLNNISVIDSLIDSISEFIDVDLNANEKTTIKINWTKYSPMINYTVESLKNASCFPGFRERERLIDLTHMKLWKDAIIDIEPKMKTEHSKDLIEEACFLKWRIAL